ncbi:DUF2591 domain-containing protein [Proteus cibi]|uniref:DUF2591 domain-containing protein n=1 Tax=Proteus cibi TaxID=2050966 RepID=A0ABU6E9D8_9GAMM|nr:phage protein NinX family protein [Proteus cibi]MEB6855672.1 DUF2591 domain-containing protein [Proteus cibi]MEB7088335.1 DUF2591 domain-containing protein [Proteus cibi]
MNKYTELSDFEINKLVACKLRCNDEITETLLNKLVFVNGNIFTPCSNPSDAMTIIIENKISVIFDTGCKEWAAGIAYWVDGYEWQVSDEVRKNNPLRAAMELFLIIKDAENEG